MELGSDPLAQMAVEQGGVITDPATKRMARTTEYDRSGRHGTQYTQAVNASHGEVVAAAGFAPTQSAGQPNGNMLPLIEACALRKTYRIRFAQRGVLVKQIIMGLVGGDSAPIVAIDGIDLCLHRGEALGVIGPNGSGKSTLLRLICGLTQPASGTLTIRGRTVGMLELGAGFQPGLSGRQNIYLNGLLHGLTPKQARGRAAEVAAFADLGEFLDAPLKTYSSGMALRLGFACAIHAAPDILIVDEVIEVGDAAFKARCFDALQRLRASGVALVLATHATEHVRQHCDQLLHLDAGRPHARVLGRDAIAVYLDELSGGAPQLREALAVERALREARLPTALAAALARARSTMRWRLPQLAPPQRLQLLTELIARVRTAAAAHDSHAELLDAFTDLWLDLLELADGTTVLKLWDDVRGLLRELLPVAGHLAHRVALLERLEGVLRLEPGPLKATLIELRELLRPQLAQQAVTEGETGPALALLRRLAALGSATDIRATDDSSASMELQLLFPADGHLASASRINIALAISGLPTPQSITLELNVVDSSGTALATSKGRLDVQAGSLRVRFASTEVALPAGGHTLLASINATDLSIYRATPLTVVSSTAIQPWQLGGRWWREGAAPTVSSMAAADSAALYPGAYAAEPQWRAAALALARNELAFPPDPPATLWKEGWQKLADFGALGLLFPTAVGGRGAGAVAMASVYEALGETCRDRGLLIGAATTILAAGVPLWRFGKGERQLQWLRRLATGETCIAYALSEPGSGSDHLAMRTRAVRLDAGYLLTGEKAHVLLAPAAEAFLVYALTDPDAGDRSMSLFVIPATRAGLKVVEHAKHVLLGAPWGSVFLDGVQVNDDERIGAQGDGVRVLEIANAWERGLVLAPLLGLAQASLAATCASLAGRQRFGSTLADFQALRHRCVELDRRIHAARMWLYRAAAMLESDAAVPDVLWHANLAKLEIGATVRSVALAAQELAGATGLHAQHPAIRDLADAITAPLLAGATDLLREQVAAKLFPIMAP
jgi:ABC-type polysaccharide/polyol phosphate transport system ATPase subunit/alkylation response protein AidB-like acyl-CoA dehydrogenase